MIAKSNLFNLLKAVEPQAKSGTPTAFYLFNPKKKLTRGPEDTRQKLLDTPNLRGKLPKGWTVLASPAKMTVISCEASPTNGCPGTGSPQGTFYYLFKYKPDASHPVPEATGADLKLSAIRGDLGTQPGQGTAIVQLGFKSSGNRKFHEITRDEAARGQAAADAAGQGSANDLSTISRFAQHFAIVLDGDLKSTPYINYKDNPDGIDPTGGGAELSNVRSRAEARELAVVLRAGPLPFRLVLVPSGDGR